MFQNYSPLEGCKDFADTAAESAHITLRTTSANNGFCPFSLVIEEGKSVTIQCSGDIINKPLARNGPLARIEVSFKKTIYFQFFCSITEDFFTQKGSLPRRHLHNTRERHANHAVDDCDFGFKICQRSRPWIHLQVDCRLNTLFHLSYETAWKLQFYTFINNCTGRKKYKLFLAFNVSLNSKLEGILFFLLVIPYLIRSEWVLLSWIRDLKLMITVICNGKFTEIY